ncbi:hypothetical protein ACP6ES_19805, partial [Klebsiella quasipneumoniae]
VAELDTLEEKLAQLEFRRLFTVVFIGMSLGSVLGSKLYVLAGWNGVVTLAVVSGAIALAIRLLENARIVAAERRAS